MFIWSCFPIVSQPTNIFLLYERACRFNDGLVWRHFKWYLVCWNLSASREKIKWLKNQLMQASYCIFTSPLTVHWEYAYESYAYAQHTLMNCVRMLSIRFLKNTSTSCRSYTTSYRSYTYAEHMLTNRMRMLSIRIQFVLLCWAYAYNLQAYA